MKWVIILLMLSILAGDASSQSSVQFIFNVRITDQCQGGNPPPDGTPVIIFRDHTNDGPSIDDGPVCDGIPDCLVNFESFELPDSGEGQPVPWTFLEFPGSPLYIYLLICIGDVHYYTGSFEIAPGFWEFIIGAEGNLDIFCVEGACDVCLPPMQPFGLTASNNDCGGILVTWQHDLFDVCGFEVQRDSVLAHTFDEVPQSLEYFDEEAGGGEHIYRVQAIRCCSADTLLSVSSSPISGFQRTIPNEIDSIWIDTLFQEGIRICWTDVPNELGYRIMRDGVQIVELMSNMVSFSDFAAIESVPYLYQVIPFNQCGDGPAASVIWVPPVEPVLTADPPVIDFGEVNTEEQHWTSVTITNTSGSIIELLDAELNQDPFTLGFDAGPLNPGQSTEIGIEFFPESAGTFYDTLRIIHSHESSPLLIPVQGMGVEFHLTLDPPDVDFGDVLVGTTETRSVTIINDGDWSCNITGGTFWPYWGGFSFDGLQGNLPPGSQLTFIFTFVPEEERDYSTNFFIDHNVFPDWIIGMSVHGRGIPEDAEQISSSIPHDFYLSPAYPNPFNPSTTISFGLPQESHVSLMVFDISGRFIQTLSDRTLPAGVHSIQFDGANLSSGVYFYRLTVNNFTANRKMVLLK